MKLKIEHLNYIDIKNHLKKIPCVIIPLGGAEPFGTAGALGTEIFAVEKIAEALSEKTNVLVAPTINYACSAPFISFHGAAGVKPRTFINSLCEIIGGYVFQGVYKIFLLNAAPFNAEPIAEVIARLKKKFGRVEIKLLDINSFENAGQKTFGFDRNDAALLTLAQKNIGGDNGSRIALDEASIKNIAQNYKTWKKRGRDPQKLYKLFPNALFGVAENLSFKHDNNFFDLITKHFYNEMTVKVALSLGSNLGDREKNISEMTNELSDIMTCIKTTPVMETEPVGVSDEQPLYLNKIIVGRYAGTLDSLFAACAAIEKKLGRVREADKPKAARTADVDILLYGNFAGDYIVVNDNTLTIPHRELLNRRFCVDGLRMIDPQINIPNNGAVEKIDVQKLSDQKIIFIN